MPGNVECWQLWQAVSTQWRVAGTVVVGLDYPAVMAVAQAFEIEATAELIEKIRFLEALELERQQKKSSGSNAGKKKHTGT